MPQLKDHITTLNAHKAIQASFAALTGLANETPDYQVAATALLLRVMVDRAGLDMNTVLDQARRMETHADDFFRREVKALRDYVDEEIKRWTPTNRPVSAEVYQRAFDPTTDMPNVGN